MSDNTRKLYDNLKQDGYTDIGEFEDFEGELKDLGKREKLYNNLVNDGYSDLGTVDDFNSKIGYSSLPNKVAAPASQEDPVKKGFLDSFVGDVLEKVNAGAADMFSGVFGLLDKGTRALEIIPGVKSGGVFKQASDYFEKDADVSRDNSNRYNGQSYSDLWKQSNYSGAIGDIVLQGAESLPMSIAAAVSGPVSGLAGIGAITASQKYDDLDESNADMGELAKIANSLLTGSAEALSEKLGAGATKLWMKSLYKTMGKDAAENAVKTGVMGMVKDNFKKYGILYEPLMEGIEEVSSQLAENITDKMTGADPTRDIKDGLFDSFIYGTGGGAYFSAAGVPGVVNNQYQKIKTRKDYNSAKSEFERQFAGDPDVQIIFKGLESAALEEQSRLLEVLNSDPDLSDSQKEAAANLIQSNIAYRARRSPEAIKEDKEVRKEMMIRVEMKNYDIEVSPLIAENGAMQQVCVNGDNPVFITKGNVSVVQSHEGKLIIDKDNSDQELYYQDGDGKMQVVPPSQVTGIVGIYGVEDARANYEANLRAQLDLQEQMAAQEQGQQIENGDNIIYTDNSGKQSTGVVSDAFSSPEHIFLEDGSVVPRNLIAKAPIQTAVIEQDQPLENNSEPATDQEIPTEQQPVQYPLDKDGGIDYSQINDPQVYANALTSEFGEEAIAVINESIETKKVELEKAGKSSDPIKKRRMISAASTELKRLGDIRDILSPKEQEETNQNATIAPGQESILSELPQNDREFAEWALDESDNTDDLLSAYDISKKLSSVEENLPRWQQELLGKKVKSDSFYRFGDRNKVGGGFAKAWLKKDGVEIDTFADELSEYGVPVTTEDIISFMLDNPTNYMRKTSDLQNNIARKWSETATREAGVPIAGPESATGKVFVAMKQSGVLNTGEYKTAIESDMKNADDVDVQSFFNEWYSELSSKDVAESTKFTNFENDWTEEDYNEIYDALDKELNSKQDDTDRSRDISETKEDRFSEEGVGENNQSIRDGSNPVQDTTPAETDRRSDEGEATDSKLTYEEFLSIRPAVDGYLYHGSPEGDLVMIDPFYHTRNWKEGIGFYTTDSRDAAEMYANGRTARKDRVVGKGRINYIKPNQDVKILDMDSPIDVELWKDIAERLDAYPPKDAGSNSDAYREIIDLLDDPNSQYAMEEVLSSFYDATTHIESKEEAPHRVTIWKNPSKSPLIVSPEDVFKDYSTKQAISRAEQQVDTNPTEAQKEAGNYKKGHVKLNGFDITIENPAGSIRSGKDASGKEWSVTMQNTYGYIRGTEGVDGDHIDVYIGSNPESGQVFVVDQVNPDGVFDEHKVMMGFDSEEEAEAAYLSNYEEGWQGLGSITDVLLDDFRKWIDASLRKTKPFAKYKSFQVEFTPKESISYKDIANFEGDVIQKQMAIDYLNGEANAINTIAYENIKNQINERDRSRVLDGYGDLHTVETRLNEEAVRHEPGRSGRSGEQSEGQITGGSGAVRLQQQDSETGRARDLEGDGVLFGTRGDQQVRRERTGSKDDDAGNPISDGRSRTGRNGYNGRTGGKSSDTTAPIQTKERRDRVRSINEEESDALNDLFGVLDEFKKAGKGVASVSLVGMNPKQIEITAKIISSGARYGYVLVKKGLTKFSDWAVKVKDAVSDSFRSSGFTDKDIDDFVSEMWSCKVPNENGVLKRVSEWADEIGIKDTKKLIRSSFEEKLEKQKAAEFTPTKVCDLSNIQEALPFLLPEQHDDVLMAEKQFFGENKNNREDAFGKGYMFTNGTGTGKTYTGLGIIKRFVKQGKKNILIVVPSQQKVSDWISDGKNLGLNITSLSGVKDAGKDVNITTYANFGVNSMLYNREFDLVMYDESHRLMEEKEGSASSRTQQHYLISNKDEWSAQSRLQKLHPLWIREKELNEEYKSISGKKEGVVEDKARAEAIKEELSSIRKQQSKIKPEFEEPARKAVPNTKVVFLSATPFKGHFNIRYAESYLFKYPDKQKGGYNSTNPEEEFFLTNFGAAYKMRYNRLERSSENPDMVAMQEIAFHEKLKSNGVMSGRMINSDMDYSRDFPTVTGFNSTSFNDALNDVFNYSEGEFKDLSEGFSKIFHDYNYSTKLFEVLKVSAAKDRINKHLDLGRKVVIFHRRKQGDLTPPFRTALETSRKMANELDRSNPDNIEKKSIVIQQIMDFKKKYTDLLKYEATLEYEPVQTQLQSEYGNRCRLFNGDIPQKQKEEAVRLFNQDGSGVDIIVIQEESGKEGISLHDTSGTHQRVLMNMALPISSVTSLQIEGRIYRIGNRSNAIFEYPLLGLDTEIYHFGSTINKRLSTTENLAMGESARDLLNSFAQGVLDQQGDIDVSVQGTGGKEFDKRQGIAKVSDYTKAIADYYNNVKKTSRNKSSEGIDYFPTPEPIGYKMIEWGDLKDGEEVLEPSAGHGAIARYVPKGNKLTAIEPSMALFSRLQARAGGGIKRFEQVMFEDYHITNKHDAIIMNPPFGKAGKTAMDHLEKAFSHLRNGGRIVAIIPNGNSMQKRLDNFLYGENDKKKKSYPDAYLRAEITLPACAFERAGTNVSAKVVIIDKIQSDIYIPPLKRVEFDGVNNVKDLFDRLEGVGMPNRIEVKSAEKEIDPITNLPSISESEQDPLFKEVSEEKDTRDDSNVFIVRANVFLGDKFYSSVQLARENKGGYSKNKKGFLFREKESAEKFRDSANSKISIGENPLYRIKVDRIEKLRNSKPVEITGKEIPYSEDLKQYKKNALEYGKSLRGEYINKDTGERISITGGNSRGGIREILQHDYKDIEHLQSIAAISKIIEESIFIDELPNEDKDKYVGVKSFRYFVSGLKISNVDYTVKSVIAVQNNGDRYYDHKLTNIEKGKLLNSLSGITNLGFNQAASDTTNPEILKSGEVSDIKDKRLLSILQTEEEKKEEIASEIESFSNSLNTPVHIIHDVNDIVDEVIGQQTKKRGSKGWYDPKTGEVYVVLPNAESVADVQSTVFHEIVGHKGLRGLLGENFSSAMGSIFDSLPKEIQTSLLDEFKDKNVSAEEYCAHMAETMSDPGIIQKICSAFKNILRKIGIRLKMTDGDIMYMLWNSKNRLEDRDTAFETMNKIKGDSFVSSQAKDYDSLFRSTKPINKLPVSIERRIDVTHDLQSKKERLYEGYVDRMISVRKLQDLIVENTGNPIPDYMNAWMYENTLSSRNGYEIAKCKEIYGNRLKNSIKKLTDAGLSERDVDTYVLAKHGLERNEYMRLKALRSRIDTMSDDVKSDLLTLIEGKTFGEISEINNDAISEIVVGLANKDYSGLTAIQKELGDESIEEFLAETEAEFKPEITGLLNSIKAINDFSLKKWFDSGMIDRASYDRIRGMFKNYVPLRGFDETMAHDVYEYYTETGSSFNSPLKKMDGRTSRAKSPFPHLVSMAESSIVGGNKNLMKLHFYRMAQHDISSDNPSGKLSIVKQWYVYKGTNADGVEEWAMSIPEYADNIEEYRKNVEKHNEEMLLLESEGKATKKPEKLKIGYVLLPIESEEHIVDVKLNGERIQILVHGNPKVAQAVNGINDESRPDKWYTKTISWANRQMAANFTTRNPAFVFSNLSRDLIWSTTALSVKENSRYRNRFLGNIPKASKALVRMLKKKQDMNNPVDVMLDEFLKNGGRTGYTSLYSIEKYKKDIQESIKTGKWAKTKKGYNAVLDFMQLPNEWAEDLSRFSTYMTSRQEGRTVLQSVSDAKEVTVNFNRKGSGAYGAGALKGTFLFFNAAIQSLNNAIRLGIKNKIGMAATLGGFAAAGLIIPTILSMLGADDDKEKYNGLPDYIRKNNLCIPLGWCGIDGFLKIPLPIELRAFYGIGDAAYRAWIGEDEVSDALCDVGMGLLDLLPLNPAGGTSNYFPDAIKPVLESYVFNEDFTGMPIAKVTPFNEYDPEYQRVYRSASVIPVTVAEYLNIATGGDEAQRGWYDEIMAKTVTKVSPSNPAALEHLFEAYFGGMFTTMNQSFKTFIGTPTGMNDFSWRNVPVVNRFYDTGEIDGTMMKVNEMYSDYLHDMKEAKSAYHKYENLSDNSPAIESAKYMDKLMKFEQSNEWKRAEYIEIYAGQINDYMEELKETTDDSRKKELQKEINIVKKEMVDGLKNGKVPE